MAQRDPYLIQRLERLKTGEKKISECRFGEVFGLDYMGSAEYEFGAFPRFLRAMNGAPLASFKATINGKQIFGLYDTRIYESDSQVIDIIQGIADHKYRHKEMPYFPPDKEYMSRVTAWADISNNLFWSFENLTSSLPQCFANSVQYMNDHNK